MSIDYEQLKTLVEEAISEDLNIMEPSGPEGVPHRMPAADPSKEEGDPKTNELYELALVAREATEKLVEALDEPVYDRAFEQAFKATTCLRRALNSLEESGAYPHAQDRVVAPPPGQQRYSSIAGAYAGGGGLGIGGGVYGANYLDEANGGKLHSDVARLADLEDRSSGLEAARAKIDTRAEFVQHLASFIDNAKTNLKPNDIKIALAAVLADLRKER